MYCGAMRNLTRHETQQVGYANLADFWLRLPPINLYNVNQLFGYFGATKSGLTRRTD